MQNYSYSDSALKVLTQLPLQPIFRVIAAALALLHFVRNQMTTSILRTKLVAAVAALSLLTVTGCAEGGGMSMGGMGNKETIGSLGGAVAGGVIGSRFGGGSGKVATTIAGTLLGGYLGNQIGASLDRADQAYASQAFNQAYAAPVGQSINWNNPQSGNNGSITTTRDGYSSAGYYCREFQQTITVGGRSQQAYGTACQNPDGTWQIQQ